MQGGLKTLSELVQNRAHELYALYDAAQDKALLQELERQRLCCECLFSGTKAITLRNVAPYLVPCRPFAGQPDAFLRTIWGRGVSMLIQSETSQERLRLQLKKNTWIKNSLGVECYFRYYDARAFSRFVRIATKSQLSELFGQAVQSLYWVDSEQAGLCQLSRQTPNWRDKIVAPHVYDFAMARVP